MGTRGAVGFKLDNEYKVTYNHFDSYPSGLGEDVVGFCRTIAKNGGVDALKEKVRAVVLVKEGEAPTDEIKDKYKDHADLGVSNQTLDDWYCLLRDFQGVDTLEGISNGTLGHMIDSYEFLKDSLFCEYAYILNLDKGTLEFYQGFNKSADEDSPLPFKQVGDGRENCDGDVDGYFPVRYVGSMPLDAITDEWQEFYKEEE